MAQIVSGIVPAGLLDEQGAVGIDQADGAVGPEIQLLKQRAKVLDLHLGDCHTLERTVGTGNSTAEADAARSLSGLGREGVGDKQVIAG